MLEKLVKRAKQGDKDAFSELILYYKDDLYKVARSRFGKQEDDLNDAVQETIIAAFSSIDKLKKVSSFKGWLMKILINKCNDIYRKRFLYENISFESNECENYLITPQISDSNLEFDSLMEVLTGEERTIILLYYEYGYNSNEISEILDIKPNTIRSKLARARKKIANKNKGELKI